MTTLWCCKWNCQEPEPHLIAVKPKHHNQQIVSAMVPGIYIRYSLSLHRHGQQCPLELVYQHPWVRVDVSDCASWCCKGSLTILRRILYLDLAKGNPK
jgi:hypothetical protein